MKTTGSPVSLFLGAVSLMLGGRLFFDQAAIRAQPIKLKPKNFKATVLTKTRAKINGMNVPSEKSIYRSTTEPR